jgi:uncharacterized protein YjiS (DUF1127 family)
MHLVRIWFAITSLVQAYFARYMEPVIVQCTNDVTSRNSDRFRGKRRTNMTTITSGREAIRNGGTRMTSGLMGRVKSFLARSRAERQLAQLDDRLLADIGLRRSEIHKMVWGN